MVGRPKDPEKAAQRKQKMQQAARDLLLEKSYRSITIREIAARAGVQSAMISYDFGSKQALFTSLIELQHKKIRGKLSALEVSPDTSLDQVLQDLYGFLLNEVTNNLWLPRLVADEVIQQDGAFSQMFIAQVLSPLANNLTGIVSQLQALGKIRADFPPNLVAMNIMASAMFPVLTYPISQKVWGYSIEHNSDDAWKHQLVSTLSQGITGEIPHDR